MKKKWLIVVGGLGLILAMGFIFREPIIDALPIDQSGWVQRDGRIFYRNEKGDPLTGWQTLEGKRCFFDSNGILCTGWLEVEGQRFYLTEAGTPVSGWQMLNEKNYYFSGEGVMHTGWLELDGQKYYLLPDGTAASGSMEIDAQTHHFNPDGTPLTGWQEMNGSRCRLDDFGRILIGWQEIDGFRFYLTENGSPVTGWQEIEGNTYYFDDDGAAHDGWLEQDGKLYYMTESGMARGKQIVDGKTCFFTSTGANIIVVNPWNFVPEDYQVELVDIYGYYGQVDASCAEALQRMLADCQKAGCQPNIASSYRTHDIQTMLHERMIADYISMGYDEDRAKAVVSQISAVPGTSEHQLGLAVDIVDSAYTTLFYEQALTPTQVWLMEHCWEYGFILRYPKDATDWTGVVYEPWHYRYVGTELSLELRDLGICLEEYLHNLTEE